MSDGDAQPHSRELIQAAGLRATRQRVLVLDALRAEQGDHTPASLHDLLVRRHPGIGLATIYRSLAALVDARLVESLQHGHGTCYRWCAPGHHHHLTCRTCHRVVELRECGVAEWAGRIGRRHGFARIEHSLELTGTCASCAAA